MTDSTLTIDDLAAFFGQHIEGPGRGGGDREAWGAEARDAPAGRLLQYRPRAAEVGAELRDLGMQLQNREITLVEWQIAFREKIRALHVLHASIAVGGMNQILRFLIPNMLKVRK